MMCPLFQLLLLSTASSWSSASPSLTSPAFTCTHIPANNAPPSSSRHRFCTAPKLSAKPPPTLEQIHAESEQLRQEIEELRAEALRRLEALENMLNGPTAVANGAESSLMVIDAALQQDEFLPPPPPSAVIQKNDPDASADGRRKTAKKSADDLLDGTTWDVSLNIGREPGTWMPKSWGSTGRRLRLSFRVEFTPDRLRERDDFFSRGGYDVAPAKRLRIVDDTVVLGPSLTEGQRVYRLQNPGGWRVTRGDGPMGTDLLRFYIELEEEVSHGDVEDLYVPKGRVYCSCGYFPFFAKENRSGGGAAGTTAPSMKESYAEELQSIEDRIQKLQEKRAEITNPFSLDGFKLSREVGKLRREAESVVDKLNYASVREPDRSLLKFSKDMDVALTREGGVCCRVEKGPMVVEYHILGRFSIASVDSSDSTK